MKLRQWLLVLAVGGIISALGFEVRQALAAPRMSPNSVYESSTGISTYLGTIDATTTSKTNHQATTAFSNTGNALCGKVLLIQNAATVSVRLNPVATNTGTVSNSRGAGFGPEIFPNERVIIFMEDAKCYLAAIATSSTGNVDVWELQ